MLLVQSKKNLTDQKWTAQGIQFVSMSFTTPNLLNPDDVSVVPVLYFFCAARKDTDEIAVFSTDCCL